MLFKYEIDLLGSLNLGRYINLSTPLLIELLGVESTESPLHTYILDTFLQIIQKFLTDDLLWSIKYVTTILRGQSSQSFRY